MRRMIFLFLAMTGFPLFGEAKNTVISFPNLDRHSINDIPNILEISTNEEGIINSVVSLNDEKYIPPTITIDENKITINSKERSYSIGEIIIMKDEIWVRGGPKSIYTKNGSDYLHIAVNKAQGIIYEHDEIKLVKTSEQSLEDVYKLDFSGFISQIYRSNILQVDYRYRENTIQRMEYKKEKNNIIITYYYMDDKISTDIIISGDSLHSNDNLKNVVNYHILVSVHPFISLVLFPTIFLENPF